MVNVNNQGSKTALNARAVGKTVGRSNAENPTNHAPDSSIGNGYDNSSELISPNTGLPQYAFLKYGDNAQLLFNVNCQVIMHKAFSHVFYSQLEN